MEQSPESILAELAEAQTRVEELPRYSLERRRLESRCRELLERHAAEWLGELPSAIRISSWRRGEPHAARLDLEEIDERCIEFFARWPIRRLILEGEGKAEDLASLLAREELGSIQELDLRDEDLDEAILSAVLNSPRASRIEALELSEAICEPETVLRLERAGLDGMRHLSVTGYLSSGFGDEGVQRLAETHLLARLEHLGLHQVSLSAEGAAALAMSPHAARLRALHLGGGSYGANHIGAEGARAIADSPHLAGLRELGLNFNRIGEAGVEAIAKSAHLRSLVELHLQAQEFTHEGFKHLAVSDVLDTVRLLDLGHNELDPRAVESLARANPPELRALWLHGNPIGDRGLISLIRSPLGAALRDLNVASTGLSDAGADELANAEGLETLESLRCGLNRLSDESKRHLRQRLGHLLRDEV